MCSFNSLCKKSWWAQHWSVGGGTEKKKEDEMTKVRGEGTKKKETVRWEKGEKMHNVTIPLHPMTALEVLCWESHDLRGSTEGDCALLSGRVNWHARERQQWKRGYTAAAPHYTTNPMSVEWRGGGSGKSECGRRRTVTEDGGIRLVYVETLPK